MDKSKKQKISDEEFIKICNESKSMRRACAIIGIPFSTFVRRAKKLGCYRPNFGGKGLHREKISIEKIFNCEEYIKPTHLKRKLFHFGYKEEKCELCGVKNEWNGKPLTLELHHIDGNRFNNRLDNLQILCPNCHSQIDNNCGKKVNSKMKRTDKDFIEALKSSKTIGEALMKLGLAQKGANYFRATKILEKMLDKQVDV